MQFWQMGLAPSQPIFRPVSSTISVQIQELSMLDKLGDLLPLQVEQPFFPIFAAAHTRLLGIRAFKNRSMEIR
jgi:hypothetical protein